MPRETHPRVSAMGAWLENRAHGLHGGEECAPEITVPGYQLQFCPAL